MGEKEQTNRGMKADATKRSIYQKAMRLFKKKGYDSVKIIDICKAANVSVGTFYYYYKSKEDIIECGITKLEKAMNSILKSYTPTNPISNIRYFVAQQMKIVSKFNSEDLAIIYGYRLLLIISGNFNMQQHTDRLSENDFLFKEVNKAISEGFFRSDLCAQEVVETIRRQSRGCAYDWCLHKYSFDLVETRLKDLNIMIEAWSNK